MILPVVIMFCVCIGLPLFYAWRVFRLDAPSILAWLLVVAEAGAVVSVVFLAGRWDMAGYHVRYLVVVLFLFATLRSLSRHRSRPWNAPDGHDLRGRWSTLISLLLLATGLGYILSGTLPPGDTRDVAFPLYDGGFVVAQGGGVGLLNHHAGHDEQHFAADITAINGLGFRASGLAPRILDSYEIFGAPVVSPCAGDVTAARDDLPDLVPPARDRENPRGNHAIIDCGAFDIELAHLKSGSVSVAAGDRLKAGDRIGEVGNSGNTTEPHLHVHAVDPDTGSGVPLTFEGRWPVRNRLFAIPERDLP
ncbi:MAG: M23 family metallopeptidase [Nitratireductor sp.]|nr:M23 family metallopeptidase [Nitratireductor sp.]